MCDCAYVKLRRAPAAVPSAGAVGPAPEIKGLVISYSYGEVGATNGKIAGPKLFAPPPPPQIQGKTFQAPPYKEWKHFAPPLKKRLKLQYLVKSTPKLVVPPPPPSSAWLKLFPPPPPFRRGKTSHSPPPLL